MATMIQVRNLSKLYRLGALGARSLREDVSRLWGKLRAGGREVSASGTPEAMKRAGDFWALRDVSFEVQPGEVVGIIGKNGAGKSTLLKILSRITQPTSGEAVLKGRVASLLEVGTGFHPELSGRENIYLNGAILGMKKAEVASKFDEIVAFAEVEQFIDTPVKRYSSGMYVRLAFAVAAHLEPDLLIVDEVLAVGDIEFQKKCLASIRTAARNGRTVLFVSHHMASVSSLCSRAVCLDRGTVVCEGLPEQSICEYLKLLGTESKAARWRNLNPDAGQRDARLLEAWMDQDGEPTSEVLIDRPLRINIRYECLAAGSRLSLCLILSNAMGTPIFSSLNSPSAVIERDPLGFELHDAGSYHGVMTIPGNFLNDGLYTCTVVIQRDMSSVCDAAESAIRFRVNDNGAMKQEYHGHWVGVIRPRMHWHTQAVT